MLNEITVGRSFLAGNARQACLSQGDLHPLVTKLQLGNKSILYQLNSLQNDKKIILFDHVRGGQALINADNYNKI
jgi:hypothetical protein